MNINPKVVDISHYDYVHPGGFAVLRLAGYVGIINKATEGPGMIDKTYRMRWHPAHEAGLCYGAYHFLRPGNVADQVDHFLSVAMPDDTILLALDHEDKNVPLGHAREFCERVHEQVKRYPVLYSGFLIKEQLPKPDPFWAGIRLWLSHYSAHPSWPAAWTAPWLWQFTGDGDGPTPHTCPGISIDGGMDLNSFAGSDDELLAQWAT